MLTAVDKTLGASLTFRKGEQMAKPMNKMGMMLATVETTLLRMKKER